MYNNIKYFRIITTLSSPKLTRTCVVDTTQLIQIHKAFLIPRYTYTYIENTSNSETNACRLNKHLVRPEASSTAVHTLSLLHRGSHSFNVCFIDVVVLCKLNLTCPILLLILGTVHKVAASPNRYWL